MKTTLEEIKLQHAKDNDCKTWEKYLEDTQVAWTKMDYDRMYDEIAERYLNAKLQEAAEKIEGMKVLTSNNVYKLGFTDAKLEAKEIISLQIKQQ